MIVRAAVARALTAGMLAFFVLPFLAAAQLGAARTARRDRPPLTVGNYRFHRTELANGLQALAVQDEGESASVFVVVGAGRRHETVSTTGLAHLTEHAMFAGTDRVGPGEHERTIRELGGESNAYTRDDTTLYYDHRIPTQELDRVLAMEADRLRGLALIEEAFLHERERLRAEEQQKLSAVQRRVEIIESLAYRVHPYGAGALDADGHTRGPSLDAADVRWFHELHYRPDNTAVVVVTPLAPVAALDAIERAFGALPRGKAPEAVQREPEPQSGSRFTYPSDLTRRQVHHAWLVPAMGHADRPALAVLARLLSRSRSADGSRIQVTLGHRVDQELFRATATGPQADAELERLIAHARTQAAPPAELADVKRLLRDDFTALSVRGRPYLSLAAAVATHHVLGHPDRARRHAAEIDAVTAEELLDVAQRYLTPERRVAVTFLASDETLVSPSESPAGGVSEADELARAEERFSELLAGDLTAMDRAIALASRGEVRLTRNEFEGAASDFAESLALVDHPAVRELLDEARRREGAGESPSTRPASDGGLAELEARVADLQPLLEEWRGLHFVRPVVIEVDAAPEKSEACWYDAGSRRLIVAAQAAVARDELLHELHHALQDQHVDLGATWARVSTDPDALHAAWAVIEGEALLAVADILGEEHVAPVDLPPAGEVSEERHRKDFHSRWALPFVRAVRDDAGAEGLASLLRDPPRSTSVILRSDRSRETPPAVELPVTGHVTSDVRRGPYGVAWLLVRKEETRPVAWELASLVVSDRVRMVRTPGGGLTEHWDLRFADGADARGFVRSTRRALRSDGWSVRRQGADVRLARPST